MPGDSEPTKRAMRAYSPSWRRTDITLSRCVGSRPLRAAAWPCTIAARMESPQPFISGVMSLVSGLLLRSCSAFSTSPLAMPNSVSDELRAAARFGRGRQRRRQVGHAHDLLLHAAGLRVVLVVGQQPRGDLLGVARVVHPQLVTQHVVEGQIDRGSVAAVRAEPRAWPLAAGPPVKLFGGKDMTYLVSLSSRVGNFRTTQPALPGHRRASSVPEDGARPGGRRPAGTAILGERALCSGRSWQR